MFVTGIEDTRPRNVPWVQYVIKARARKKFKKRNVMTEIDSFRDIELHALPYDLPWDAGYSLAFR